MSPPTAVDILPRHLQSSSASSSSNASPAGTPPTASQPALLSSYTRSPASSSIPLPSPGGGIGTLPPGSPSSSSSNRFGLSLGFIQRRPRGWTTSSAQRSPNARGSPSASPATELPPSPGGERPSSGYGFPALRRTLSKRTSSSNANDGVRSRQKRSSSQPPVPAVGIVPPAGGEAAPGAGSGELRTGAGNAEASTSASQQQPPAFSPLAATTSLPNPPNDGSSTPSRAGTAPDSSTTDSTQVQKIRLVPHLESSRSLHFEPIERDLAPFAIIRVGRFTDRHSHHGSGSSSTNTNAARGTPQEPARIAFKSKVVSRGHAEIWVDDQGKFFIRDTKSSSGTFLNHIRLSGPNIESRASQLKDGDVLQLGVDYQGGTEEIYRCVKMRVELNRGWQRQANSFNTAALAQLRALGGIPDPSASSPGTPSSAPGATATLEAATAASTSTGAAAEGSTSTPAPATPSADNNATMSSISDCCICLYGVTVAQALFIAPCSHVTHFKCIRPLIEQNYPGFCCPLCRTYADLEADVEIDLPEPTSAPAPPASTTVANASADTETGSSLTDEPMSLEGSALGLAGRSPPMAVVAEAEEPISRAGSIRSGVGARLSASRRSSAHGLAQSFAAGEARARSRPASIAPAAEAPAEEEESERDVFADAEGGAEEESSEPGESHEGSVEADSAPQQDTPSRSTIKPAAIPASRLSPPAADDLYASLASAATPPNNTFLSTLADSTARFGLTSAAASFFGSSRPHRPSTLTDAGPSRVSLTGSGSGTNGSDLEGDDGETQEAGSSAAEDDVVSLMRDKGKGKGKAKEAKGAAPASTNANDRTQTKQGRRNSTLFPPPNSLEHPDPSVAAALFI
ncbi:membrane protein [Rhodotorula toruloides]|uniref:Membrane protein n=1 Tax=Rhodotorula toruloides TaxID=5286 RepID=A0A511KAY8_RHOTO|nr:membrane protein [Rhodotorula toruloides]